MLQALSEYLRDPHGEANENPCAQYEATVSALAAVTLCNGMHSDMPGQKRVFDTPSFIKCARFKHGDKYSYDKVVYHKSREHVTITCPVHGDFSQTPNKHLQGGCNECGTDIITMKNLGRLKDTTATWIVRARSKHGDTYDYSQVDFGGADAPVTIICRQHGPFPQTAFSHLEGRGCRKCVAASQTMTYADFLRRAKAVHGDLYNYDADSYHKYSGRIRIECKTHGWFEQAVSNHLRKWGCAKCSPWKPFSAVSMEWLDCMQEVDGTEIQHAGNGTEFRVPGTLFSADGYSAEKRKVYEFLGTYYHGNPRVYEGTVFNTKCRRTMGELLQRTRNRENVIREKGYDYEEIWEDEWEAVHTLMTLKDPRM